MHQVGRRLCELLTSQRPTSDGIMTDPSGIDETVYEVGGTADVVRILVKAGAEMTWIRRVGKYGSGGNLGRMPEMKYRGLDGDKSFVIRSML